ncbi:response regulator transcription factor [Paenibacillus radicis (ex Gao et al. 2016)]|uniref:DNA-binding response regulator n=1 Tax=Paenibacillus radicis (ex Gao et al. 2016) TaxID=1737354 RepID=A0A917M3D8_9BACL|nr:response regulator transcription factor [Paenibacillus radicis (ex Gao et al. 2016)]GGG76694.1 DNA-binding response regulator [Paenibacillus radicis (ex Gao et al. 2016)]
MAQHIVIADDDLEIRDVLRIYLQNEGYRVTEAEDGLQALEIVWAEPVDLLILDVMMPRMDGIRACMAVRESSDIPIIMLSAKGEPIDKIAGLTTGADDYVAKPFNPLELVARVKAQLRRKNSGSRALNDNVIEIGELVIDRSRHTVRLRGREIAFTPIEFSILELMASHPGIVFSAEKLYKSIWNEEKFISDNTIMVHIRNIRSKIEDHPREPRYIKTVWGVGYKIE